MSAQDVESTEEPQLIATVVLPTPVPTATLTPTLSPTATLQPTFTPSPTLTITPMQTISPTIMPAISATYTLTPTLTITPNAEVTAEILPISATATQVSIEILIPTATISGTFITTPISATATIDAITAISPTQTSISPTLISVSPTITAISPTLTSVSPTLMAISPTLTGVSTTITPTVMPTISGTQLLTPVSMTVQPTATVGGLPLEYIQGIASYQNSVTDNAGIRIQIYSDDLTLVSDVFTNEDGIYNVPVPLEGGFWMQFSAAAHRTERFYITDGIEFAEVMLLAGDLNNDECINFDDLRLFLSGADDSLFDMNADTLIDLSDTALLSGNLDPGCVVDIVPTETPTPTFDPLMTPNVAMTPLAEYSATPMIAISATSTEVMIEVTEEVLAETTEEP